MPVHLHYLMASDSTETITKALGSQKNSRFHVHTSAHTNHFQGILEHIEVGLQCENPSPEQEMQTVLLIPHFSMSSSIR